MSKERELVKEESNKYVKIFASSKNFVEKKTSYADFLIKRSDRMG